MLLGAKMKFYVLRLVLWLPNEAFNISDSEPNLLKFDLGVSNNLASLHYLPLVSGDNNFICRPAMKWHFSIISPVA
jgi:hypothetical protein